MLLHRTVTVCCVLTVKGFAFEGFYERKLLQTRYWDNKMYLYPIAQTEIDRGRGLVQNPGW